MPSRTALVALVSMPFISLNRPSLATALLKAILERQGSVCDVYNLFIAFAEKVGLTLYERLSVISDRQLAGERLFASSVFGPEFSPALKLPVGYDPADTQETREAVMRRLHEVPAVFLDDCLKNIPWAQYRIVGFSTMFEQNLASLALARRIKQRWPDTVIVFGGANCEGEMGLELHRKFAFVDYVCSGEGDHIFPEMVNCILEGRPVPDLPGLIRRESTRDFHRLSSLSLKVVDASTGASPISDLD